MPVTVIIGGQFGSEGKGKVAYYFAQATDAHIAVRVGGPNSGHTIVPPDGRTHILKQLPTAAFLPDIRCVLPSGSYIDPHILLSEVELTGLDVDRLFIDPNAVIISEEEKQEEQQGILRQTIGSTQSGTGAGVKRRVERNNGVRLAKHEPELHDFVRPVVPVMRDSLNQGRRILIEGTQGFGLSLLHSSWYPFATSRDTSAAAFVAEAGLSPLDVDQVVLVLRAFPIRVAGNSGPLPNEISWEIVTKESLSTTPIIEHTSVTRSVRRVARFDSEVVRQAILVNRPTHIILNHLDYIDISCRISNVPSNKVEQWLAEIEATIGTSVDYLGFGPASLVPRTR
ncbi:MAG: adenylosuccinate synthetase [Chloroflexota bacterium]|nr:adenylosuccinate synthetase [Chloroflexota bacterium]